MGLQAAAAGVALRDRVGGEQADGAVVADQVPGAAEEVSNEVRVRGCQVVCHSSQQA
ncbi:MAG: hypothetical protein IPI49_02610 [Myxococcales bacterium]|nr:hypothetical protein [Myxococcales bacterium]